MLIQLTDPSEDLSLLALYKPDSKKRRPLGLQHPIGEQGRYQPPADIAGGTRYQNGI